MSKKVSVIILCAGEGKRFDNSIPKQFYKIEEETILEINIRKFIYTKLIDNIVIVTSKELLKKTNKYVCDKITTVIGGKTRQESVKNGLIQCKKFNSEIVLIHDCARPFFNEKLVDDLINNTSNNQCCIPGIVVNDSLKKINKKDIENVSRKNIIQVQTPQSFPLKKILLGHLATKKNHTDDSSIASEINLPIKLIPGLKKNFKITDKNDIKFMNMVYESEKKNRISVGIGFDVHQFEAGEYVIICGVKIPYEKKLKGHSDADVGHHTLVDAILGSISEGDIGEHFPPSDKKWKNAASSLFVEFAKELLIKKKAVIQNIDLTFICEQPKILKYKLDIKKNISNLLSLNINKINVKATTTERLGFLGRKEGIAAQAVVTTQISEI